jgi:hypothetical protein
MAGYSQRLPQRALRTTEVAPGGRWEPRQHQPCCTLAPAGTASRLGPRRGEAPRARRCQTVDLPVLSRP